MTPPPDSSSTTATRLSMRRSAAPSRRSASRPSAAPRARPGRIPTWNASSGRSAASVWTTSSSSTNDISDACFAPTSRITSALARTLRSARTRPRHALSNRPAPVGSWLGPKSAGFIVDTSGKQPEPADFSRHADGQRGDLRASSFDGIFGNSLVVYVPMVSPRNTKITCLLLMITVHGRASRGREGSGEQHPQNGSVRLLAT
jgi:hypothetical protein